MSYFNWLLVISKYWFFVFQIVQHLLDHKADINHEDCDGRTALSVAALCIPASEGHSGVVSLLLERGAKVDHCDKDGKVVLLLDHL